MASFFNKINVPDLTQSAQSIETMVQAINDNFQKVFTLPFLKGDPGDEITTRFEYFWDDNNLLTQEAADIFNTVFEQNIFTVGIDFDKFILTLTDYQIINDENIEKPYWSDNYGPAKKPKVLLYYKINAEDTTEEKIGVAQLYYFFDPRITLLSKNDLLYNKSFKDYTCILTTEYTIDENGNYSYKYVKQTGWPTLYYNLTTSQFCWAINGHQTGINAQGVNGKDGIGSKVWLVKLNNTSLGSGNIFDHDEKYLENYYTRFSIESVWYPTSKSWVDKTEMENKLQKNSGQIFTNDDVFIGYVTGSDPLMEIGLWEYNNEKLINTNEYIKDIPIPDMWVGTLHYDETAKENEDKYFVMCNISQNLSVANNNMNLCKMLADIKPSTNNDDPNHLKGLYLRSDTNNIHAIFNGGHIETGNTDLYIAPTELKYMSNSEKIQTISNKNLNIIYNTKINGALEVIGKNNNLILNSNVDSEGKYYSNKIKFLRGTSSDNINDWYMYGNTSGLLEMGCDRSDSGEEPLLKLGRSDGGVRSVEITGATTLCDGATLKGNNTGAGGSWKTSNFNQNTGEYIPQKYIGSKCPLIITCDNGDKNFILDSKLIFGPLDIYSIDKNNNPTTLWINLRENSSVIVGNNILSIKSIIESVLEEDKYVKSEHKIVDIDGLLNIDDSVNVNGDINVIGNVLSYQVTSPNISGDMINSKVANIDKITALDVLSNNVTANNVNIGNEIIISNIDAKTDEKIINTFWPKNSSNNDKDIDNFALSNYNLSNSNYVLFVYENDTVWRSLNNTAKITYPKINVNLQTKIHGWKGGGNIQKILWSHIKAYLYLVGDKGDYIILSEYNKSKEESEYDFSYSKNGITKSLVFDIGSTNVNLNNLKNNSLYHLELHIQAGIGYRYTGIINNPKYENKIITITTNSGSKLIELTSLELNLDKVVLFNQGITFGRSRTNMCALYSHSGSPRLLMTRNDESYPICSISLYDLIEKAGFSWSGSGGWFEEELTVQPSTPSRPNYQLPESIITPVIPGFSNSILP